MQVGLQQQLLEDIVISVAHKAMSAEAYNVGIA